IGERAVVVIVIERGGGAAAARSPILAVDEKDVDPAIAIRIDEGGAGAERLGEVFFTSFAGVVDEFDSGWRRYVGELDLVVDGRARGGMDCGCRHQNRKNSGSIQT